MKPRAPALLSLMLLAGCAGGTSDAEEETPHGYVEGAEEKAEPQPTLVISDASGEASHSLDPLSEEVTPLDEVTGEVAATDGRYAYFTGGDQTTVFDSGTWTVDHGDHVHYYRADPQVLGDLDAAVDTATGDTGTTIVDTADGPVALDREKLDDGQLDKPTGLDAASAARFDGHQLAVSPDGTVEVRDDAGDQVATVDASCPESGGHVATRLGTVLGCGDSAVLVSGDAESPQAETLDYADTAGDLGHRPTSPVLTAVGDDNVELVNFVESEAVSLDVDDPVVASATGEDSPALVLESDGTVRAFDPETGEETADEALLEGLGDAAASLAVDTQRAYVTDPQAQAVHEVDYRDELRVSRSFELDFVPGAMVETGW